MYPILALVAKKTIDMPFQLLSALAPVVIDFSHENIGFSRLTDISQILGLLGIISVPLARRWLYRQPVVGSVERLGVCGGSDMTGRAVSGWGWWRGLVLQLVETRADGGTRRVELMELGRPGNLHDLADLGLTLPEAKQLLACVQQAVVPCKPVITRGYGQTARAAASGSASRIGDLAGSRPCSARWWYGCPGSAVRAAVAARRGLTGPRTAARPQSWISCKHTCPRS